VREEYCATGAASMLLATAGVIRLLWEGDATSDQKFGIEVVLASVMGLA